MHSENPKPTREYPDWHRLLPKRFREEVYKSDNDWVYYYNVDWENYLIYGMILHNKDYLIQGGMPDWFRSYIEDFELEHFDNHGEDVVLIFKKENWVENTLVFHPKDGQTENGTVFNMESRIRPSSAFLAGDAAPGRAACPQSTWEQYVLRHNERLLAGLEWNPR